MRLMNLLFTGLVAGAMLSSAAFAQNEPMGEEHHDAVAQHHAAHAGKHKHHHKKGHKAHHRKTHPQG